MDKSIIKTMLRESLELFEGKKKEGDYYHNYVLGGGEPIAKADRDELKKIGRNVVEFGQGTNVAACVYGISKDSEEMETKRSELNKVLSPDNENPVEVNHDMLTKIKRCVTKNNNEFISGTV
jgi:hypothetical protein